MTYATITTTKEILETVVAASHENPNPQLPISNYFLEKLGEFRKARKAR